MGASEILGMILREGDLVFDVGANVGTKTLNYRKLGARVVCCEPQPDCIKKLHEIFTGDPGVEVLEVGLGARPHRADFHVCSQANTISTLSERWKGGRFKNYEWDRKIPVDITTLDEVIAKYGIPKYCKIDVEGYELEVLKGLSSRVPYLSIEFCREFLDETERCIFYLMGLGYRAFNIALRESNTFYSQSWLSEERILKELNLLSDPEEWGDVWASSECPNESSILHRLPFPPPRTGTLLNEFFLRCGLFKSSEPPRLHLGCGEKHLQGYVNVDFPQERHSLMNTKADIYLDITEMNFIDGSIEEVRLHHVFEHFNRVTALALLIRWHRWLKVGGKLQIEAPDIMGSARTLLGDHSYETKMSVVRHLVGDQAADWAYHVDQWFPERFKQTLFSLGFADVQARSWDWERPPYLSNVEVTAIKSEDRSLQEQLIIADELLWESTVSDSEAETHQQWRKQLRACFGLACTDKFVFTPRVDNPIAVDSRGAASKRSTAIKALWDKIWLGRRPSGPLYALESHTSRLPIEAIQNFNQNNRDRWIATKAQTVQSGATVLDVGAGTCRYRKEFLHCNYKTHDFKQYEGYQDNSEGQYGHIDYVSDVTVIPVPDQSFDIVLCTEVLEHVPEPIAALQEMARILKPDGRLFITAPLSSGLHQVPYHYYGGFTPYWYRHFCPKFGLSVVEVVSNGGFFKLLAQECARVAWTMPRHGHVHGKHKDSIGTLFGDVLPRFLFALEEQCMIDQFTVGYHVEAKKVALPR